MAEQCVICELPCKGTQLGMNCCRACAAFFRRTQSLRLVYKCRFRSDCDVTLRNRYSCRYCRMKKCESVGLSVLPDSPSTSASTDVSPRSSVIANRDSPDCEISNFSTFYLEKQQRLLEKLKDLFEQRTSIQEKTLNLTLCQQALIAYEAHCDKWPNCKPGKIKEQSVPFKRHAICNIDRIEYIAQFCMSIDQFAQLNPEDKWKIFARFWIHFLAMDRANISSQLLGYTTDDYRLVYFDGSVGPFHDFVKNYVLSAAIHSSEAMSTMIEEFISTCIKSFVIPFKLTKPSAFEIAFLLMKALFNVQDFHGLSPETLETAKKCNDRLADEIHYHYYHELEQENYAHRLCRLCTLLHVVKKISKKRDESDRLAETFGILSGDIMFSKFRKINDRPF